MTIEVTEDVEETNNRIILSRKNDYCLEPFFREKRSETTIVIHPRQNYVTTLEDVRNHKNTSKLFKEFIRFCLRHFYVEKPEFTQTAHLPGLNKRVVMFETSGKYWLLVLTASLGTYIFLTNI